MATVLPRRASFICRTCQKLSASQPNRRQFLSQVASPPKHELSNSKPRKTLAIPLRSRPAQTADAAATDRLAKLKSTRPKNPRNGSARAIPAPNTTDPARNVAEFEKFVAQVQSMDAAADHDDVLEALMDMYEFSNVLVHGTSKISEDSTATTNSSTSQGKDLEDALLGDLAEERSLAASSPPSTQTPQQMTLAFRTNAATTVSKLSHTLLRDPKVYITDGMLQIYVRILCQLGQPEFLPEIFHLYATKPIPRADSTPVRFSTPWPRMPKYAVPIDLAEAALEAAILKKNLALAVAVIDTTVGAPAFRANKLLRQASVPGAILGATPLVAYAGADWVANWQNTMDAEMARYTAIAGALAYIGTLGTIGFVALTTYNDQMQRVVWRPGTHLSQRWLREEERRFFDRLALAWGFQEPSRWGEEHGGEWWRLRDEVGVRDMILDKTDLMEGMQ